MTPVTSRVRAVANNPWFIVGGASASIGGFVWFLYDKALGQPSVATILTLTVALTAFVCGVVYSIRVRSENIALRALGPALYEINRLYRDELQEMFYGDNPVSDPEDLLAEEEKVLRAVCQRIADSFTLLTSRKCMVTISLITKEDGMHFAETYLRSQDLSNRDKDGHFKFRVGTGANTGFDAALQSRSDGKPSHYFAADLRGRDDYYNERTNYLTYYRSALIVPIRSERKERRGNPDDYDNIGFLCVDTLSANRLNDGYQLFLLSGLASQMYNFMSLMRGAYTVVVR